MRLIDADKLIENIHKRSYISKALSEIFETVIDEQPIAYDVDKVVEQLKERSKEYNSGVRLHGKPEEMLTDEAIEIVKGESERNKHGSGN